MPSSTPAKLIIGSQETTHAYALDYLYATFCSNNSCKVCVTCTKITSEQHHGITWLRPEKTYTREALAPLFARIAFVQSDEYHIFIVSKADLLSATAANSLLKSLEEPPDRYQFLLLAHNEHLLLPTIRSRCTTTYVDTTASPSSDHPLAAIFLAKKLVTPTVFLKLVDDHLPTEEGTAFLFEFIFVYWQNCYKKASQTNNAKNKMLALSYLQILTLLLAHPIPSGSSKLWWKELYLQWTTAPLHKMT